MRMDKGLRLVQNNLVWQLTGILLVIGLLPLLTFGVLSQRVTEQAVTRLASAHSMQVLQSQQDYMALLVEQVEALAANLGQVEEITTALGHTGLAQRAPGEDSYDTLATKARMGYLLSNYRNLRGLVSIEVFSLNGDHYHVGDSLSDSGERPGLRDTLLERTFRSEASVVWHGVEDNIQLFSREAKVVVATKLLMSSNASWLKHEPVGMLVVNFSTSELHQHFSQLNLGQGASLLVLDAQQRLIYTPNAERIGTRVPPAFAQLLEGASGSSLQTVNGEPTLLSYQRMAAQNWYIVSLVPQSTLLAPMQSIRNMGWLLLLVSVLMTLLLTQVFAARVVRPIGAIAEGFKRFQQGVLDSTWRMRLPRSLPQVQELVMWFNTFLDSNAKRQEADTRLRIAATAFESQEAMLVTNAERVILQVNSAFTALTGYSAEEAVGQSLQMLCSGLHDSAFFADIDAQLKTHGHWSGEIQNRRQDGAAYLEWLTITGVKDEHGAVTHYVATMMDITQRKATEEEIRHLAFYDALTQLPNRRLLTERLQQALVAMGRQPQCAALMLLDLDKFKLINDTLGHAMGDLLLCNVAQRLLACVREGDTVARLGGDEFVVMLGGLSAQPDEAAIQAKLVGQKMLHALAVPHDLQGSLFQSSASLGVTLVYNPASSTDELMKQADIAMYQAKESGRNALRFFDPQMQQAVMARAALEIDLRQGLALHQFALYLQPVLEQQAVRGAEALVRWRHPQRGMVPPADFIALAEETGLIVPLGLWVMQAACSQLAQWAAQPDKAHWVLSVNVSPRQFHQPDFVAQVVQMLQVNGVAPAQLKIEITEGLLISNMDDAIGKMNQLRHHGVSFSLDDFGTGYASLAYLKRLPLSEIKIDQSFVRDVLSDPSDAITVRTILALGQSMGLAVVAEGVETEAQLTFLRAHGCALFQGYLFSPPMPASALDAWLAQRSA
jgi:diguanylate cyclase (GGDEF)-like protein/PAS domain S-box-containing protein